jgi:helicase
VFVCDEVQLVGDKHRGQNVELLLTLLRKAGWLQFLGLSAVLSDTDARTMGDWLQIGVVRNPTREKALRIECRSPTITHEVYAAPGRDGDPAAHPGARQRGTHEQVAELLGRELGPVIVFCMRVDDTYTLCAEWTRRHDPSVRVVPPPGLELDEELSRALARRAALHNAELSEDERLFVEQKIASGEVDVVFSTSTLAAGVNFPLSSAVFASWQRWNSDRRQYEPIGRAEFQNMAGRVGRMGQVAAEGLVLLSAEGATFANQALRLMDFTAQDELGVGITPEDFAGLTLQLFAGKLCASRDDAFQLVASTLSAAREANRNRDGIEHWRPLLERQIDRLVGAGCLIEGRDRISATAFGLAVARSGLKPETALYFLEGLFVHSGDLARMLPSATEVGAEDDLLFVLAHAALASPEFTLEGGPATRAVSWRVSRPNLVRNLFAQRLDANLWERPWAANVSAANGALLLASWASGRGRSDVEGIVPGVRLGTIEGLARDVAWILTGVSEITSEITSPTLADESKPPLLRGANVDEVRLLARSMRRQAGRIAIGLPADCVWMSSLELPGQRRRLTRPQILALRHQGLVRPIDLMDGSPTVDSRRRLALSAVDNPMIANQVRDAARRWKVGERAITRRLHLRRATRIGAERVFEDLHTAKGTALENAFEAAMTLLSIGCERLDNHTRQGYPDFLISIEDYSPIVVEIKSRQAESDLVSLNSSTEVLAASELIGLRANFCITVCSPGVEPHVPGLVERCARLCVVDVADLAEALLRVREGSLTRDGLQNWLTTPGIALPEDLPAPR